MSAPFVVINADDYYGPSAYSLLFDFLEKEEADAVPGFGMIGFRLDENLSQHGGVSRAICTCDESNYLQELIEVKEIENKDGKISGVTVAGAPFPLTGSETTSMNIWGLTPEVFPILEHQFSDYFASFAHDVGSEFLISTALNEQIANGWSTMKVLPARDRGFGMTFKADQPNVALQIERLIAEGKYPANLTDWFNENH